MKVLVTGGAGYIGSHTIVELLASGHEVAVVDNFLTTSPMALARVREITRADFPVHEVDVRDGAALAQVFAAERPEAVIHFAGLKAVGESEEFPLRYYDTNVGGTLRLLEAMEGAGCTRIVFSSSATVYGEPVYLPYDEAHPLAPANVYGRTKRIAEDLLRDWAASRDGVSAVLLRYFNPVGAHDSGMIGEDPEGIPNNLMPFLAQVAAGRRDHLSVFGDDYPTPDGTGIRDYNHVTDLARAHVAAIGHAAVATGAQAFNIGTGTGYSVLDMVRAFGRAVGRDLPYRIAPRRAGDIAEMQADPTLANTVLDWRALLTLDEMCASTWHWQSRNPFGYRNG